MLAFILSLLSMWWNNVIKAQIYSLQYFNVLKLKMKYNKICLTANYIAGNKSLKFNNKLFYCFKSFV